MVHSSSSRLTVKLSSRLMAMLEEKPLPFVQIQNIETLLKNPDRVEVSSQKSFCLRVVASHAKKNYGLHYLYKYFT